MTTHLNAVQAVGTVTVGASGNTEIFPASSNAPFTDLAISIIPIETISPYTVTVYHDGEVVETHAYPDEDDRVVCHMSYPNLIFPANVGTNAIPKFFTPNRMDYPGVPISVVIASGSATQLVFLVYATYMECVSPRFRVITQE